MDRPDIVVAHRIRTAFVVLITYEPFSLGIEFVYALLGRDPKVPLSIFGDAVHGVVTDTVGI